MYILLKSFFQITPLKLFVNIMHTKPQEYIIRKNNTYLFGLLGCDIKFIGSAIIGSGQWVINTTIHFQILKNNRKNQ